MARLTCIIVSSIAGKNLCGIAYVVGLASDLHVCVGGDMECSAATRASAVSAGAVAAIVVPEA